MTWGWIEGISRSAAAALPTSATLSKWANIAGGFSTSAAAIVAIWAYFFTDIAEELTKQYNTEVAALNEQVIDLRRERRDLDAQAQVARADKETAQAQLSQVQVAYQEDKAKLQASIETLQADKNRMEANIEALDTLGTELKAEIADLLNERGTREDELKKIEVALLKSRKDKDTLLVELVRRRIHGQMIFAILALNDLESEAATAQDIVAYSTWRIEMDKLAPLDHSRDELITVLEYANMMRSIPPSWRRWQPPQYSREPPPEFAELGTEDGRLAFRHRLSKSARRMTAQDFITQHLLGDALAPLPPDELKRVTKAVNAFVKDHAKLLSQEVAIVLSKNEAEADVAVAGKMAFGTINELGALMAGMPDEVGKLVAATK